MTYYVGHFYQPGAHEARTRLVLRLLCVFVSVCMCMCVCVCVCPQLSLAPSYVTVEATHSLQAQ